MEIKVTRTVKEDDFTIGHLTCRDVSLWTLEDAVREIPGEPVEKWKQYGMSAIPVGRYQVVLTFSQRFSKELPILLGVPGFTGVRIHAGNSAADTEGCLLVGKGLNQMGNRITDSRSALSELMQLLDDAYDRGEEVWLEIQ